MSRIFVSSNATFTCKSKCSQLCYIIIPNFEDTVGVNWSQKVNVLSSKCHVIILWYFPIL